MKTTLCLLIFTSAAFYCTATSELPESIAKSVAGKVQACKKEHNLTNIETIIDIKTKGMEHKCFILCIMKAVDLFDGGRLSIDKIKAFNEKRFVDKNERDKRNLADEACVNQLKTDITDECEVAYQYMKCRENSNEEDHKQN